MPFFFTFGVSLRRGEEEEEEQGGPHHAHKQTQNTFTPISNPSSFSLILPHHKGLSLLLLITSIIFLSQFFSSAPKNSSTFVSSILTFKSSACVRFHFLLLSILQSILANVNHLHSSPPNSFLNRSTTFSYSLLSFP